ncbi:hypothetical protein N0M98_28065 [Paenibacillus doosanensis]|uniref:cache domain-containing protein n=1 Tax=Paenibacillus doosanensis TaxID=1229154 RepID=UPI0021807CAA|nr:cache domain-containing protein [Paenibacillus doosanensis]MCS7463970.1 hypothetical protein [Paenibacillus doosanensis]
MKAFKRIAHTYARLSLRARLFLSYMMLVIVSLTILGVGYYYKSSEVILQNASETILGIVKKSDESLNSKFASVEQIAVNMHLDEDLFAFFNTSDWSSRPLSSEDDRRITRILQKYFPSSEDLYSVNLVTSQYIFGGNPYFWIPKTDFQKSNLYGIGLEAKDNTRWIPTYNLLDRFYAMTTEHKEQSQLVFTATRLINISMIQNNMLQQLPPHTERPVLVVNYQESMLHKAFAESLGVQGSYYYVLTPEGETVSASRSFEQAPDVDREWIQSALRQQSGTELIRIGGKKMVVCFDTIKTTGWLSVVFIPYDNLLGTVPNMLSYTLYSTAAMILLSIAASFLHFRTHYAADQEAARSH